MIGTGANGGKHFDIAVVGAGSAGFAAAIAAAEQGAHVALVGHGTIGGTCVNIGCVPSKTLIRAAEALHEARTASRFRGLRANGKVENWRSIVGQKDELVASLRKSKYLDLLPQYNGVAYLEGRARLVDEGIAIDDNRISAGGVIITTGASPSVPPISGIDTVPYLTSTTALDLEQLPKTLLVIGGGYIGCELSQMLARAGTKVTIVDLIPILSDFEPEIARALAGYLREDGIVLRDGVRPMSIRKSERGIALEVAEGDRREVLESEQILITTGRRPNTEGFGLTEGGVELRENGGIRVDDYMHTTRPGVYAAGDVTGRDQFVYMAAYGAKIAANNALNGDKLRYNNTAMPSVVFTDPQVASVGLTEARARAAGHNVRTSVLSLDQVPRALAARDTRGLIKLVADGKTNRLLGAHILAPEGGDSIQTAVLAIRQGLTVDDLIDMVFPYLTTVEGLKLAALGFEKDVTKLSCCAG